MVPKGIKASDEPKVKETRAGTDKNKCLEAVEEEYKKIAAAMIGEEVEYYGPGKKPLPSQMVLKRKGDLDEQPARYKGCLVAEGNRQ